MAVNIVPAPRQIANMRVKVPEDVANDLQEGAEYLADKPKEVLHATFDTESEKPLFIKQGQAWAAQNGMRFKVVTNKNAGPLALRFWVGTAEAYEARKPQSKEEGAAPSKRGRPRKATVSAAEFTEAAS